MTGDQDPHSQQLDQIIAAYLQAAETGNAPSREQLLAEYPELAEQLKAFFTQHDAMPRADAGSLNGHRDDKTVPPAQPAPDEALLAPDTLEVGTRVRYFGDYELIEEVARGGMGVVYKARQVSLNRIVALKMILAGQLASDDDVRRFHTEAEAAANLDHPSIVPVFEVGVHAGQHYFSMGYVEGSSLAERIANGPLPPREAAELTEKIAQAVAYAHQHGVIHRDLKPANVLLDQNGHPRVTDFGLAKRVQADSNLTRSGEILGTPSYMPPEQASGRLGAIKEPADVYALGAVLYATLTGRPPLQADNQLDTLLQVLEREPVPPQQLNPNVPRDLETICLKCLQKEPQKRYTAASELADDLARFQNGQPIQARRTRLPERAVKWVKRRPAIASLIAAVVIVGMAGLGGILWQWRLAVAARQVALEKATAESKANAKAQKARNEQERQRKQAEERLMRLNIANGISLLRDEDWFGSLPWFVEALKLTEGNSQQEQRHRIRLRSILQEHPRLVQFWNVPRIVDADFSPDGLHVATLSMNSLDARRGVLQVWDARTGTRIAMTVTTGSQPKRVAFSANGQKLLVTGFSEVCVYDATSAEQACEPIVHPAGQRGLMRVPSTCGIHYAALSPDGSRVATGGEFGTARLWDTSTGREVMPAIKHRAGVRFVAFSPDGKRLLTTTNHLLSRPEAEARIWDLTDGTPVTPPMMHSGIWCAAFNSDGTRVVTVAHRTARVWDAKTGQPVTPPLLHESSIKRAVFSPDDTQLLTFGGYGGAVHIWDAVTGKPGTSNMSHRGGVLHAAFSPDGSHIATAGADHMVRVWLDGRQLITVPIRHSAPVAKVIFARDGHRLLTVTSHSLPTSFLYDDEFSEVRIWDLAAAPTARPLVPAGEPWDSITVVSPDRRRIFSLAQQQLWDNEKSEPIGKLTHNGQIQLALFSPDSKFLATASRDGAVRVWNASTGKSPWPVLPHVSRATRMAFSADGTRLVTAQQEYAQVWDWRSGQPVTPVLTEKLTNSFSLRLTSQDGTRLARRVDSRTIRVVDAATGADISPLLAHEDQVNRIYFGPHGKYLAAVCMASSGAQEQVHVWNVDTGKRVTPPMTTSVSVRPFFSRDGGRFVNIRRAASRGRYEVRVLELNSGRLTTFPLQCRVLQCHDFDSDRCRVLLTGDSRSIVCDDRGQLTLLGKQPGSVTTAIFSPDGTHILTMGNIRRHPSGLSFSEYMSTKKTASPQEISTRMREYQAQCTQQSWAQVWDVSTGQAVSSVLRLGPLSGPTLTLATMSSGNHLLAMGNVESRGPSTIQVWNVRTGQAVGSTIDVPGRINRLKFSDNGKVLFAFSSVSSRDEVLLWDVTAAQRLAPPLKHDKTITSVSFSLDGTRVLTASMDGTARVWDAQSGRQIGPALGHTRGVEFAAFGPREELIATACQDKTVRIWNAKTGQPATPPLPHQSTVDYVAWSPDGRLLASCSNKLRVWNAATGLPLSVPFSVSAETVKFSADGKRLIVDLRGNGGTPSKTTILELTPDDRPVNELQQLAEFLAGRRIDAAGGFVPLEPAAMASAWEHLRGSLAEHSPRLADVMLAWEKKMAHECASRHPGKPALEYIDRLIEKEPTVAAHRFQRSEALTALGRLDDARKECEKAIELGSDNPMVWCRLARFSLILDDVTKYRETCAALWERFGATRKFYGGDEPWLTLCLAPSSLPDFAERVRQAEQRGLLQATSTSSSRACRKAAAAFYRAGRYKEAVIAITKSVADLSYHENANVNAFPMMSDLARIRTSTSPPTTSPYKCLFLAMGLAQTGNTAEARSWLKLADDQFQKRFFGPTQNSVMSARAHHSKIELQILFREAKQLLATDIEPASKNDNGG